MSQVALRGVGWFLPCTGPRRGPVNRWQDLGLRGPCELLIERDAAGERLLAVAEPGELAHVEQVVDLGGRGVCAGWVDAHTHAVFAGDRASEFNRRLAGESYAKIAAEGGGILRTVRATRAASVTELIESASPRLEEMAAWGARVVEIKTGYGLDLGSELRLLQAIEGLRDAWRGRIDVVATAMPAHAIPPERKSDPDRYVREVCEEILPAMASSGAKLDFVDVFIERGYFSVAQADAIAGRARELGLAIKAHVDEFEDVGGVPWAVDNGAVSVEHLLVTSAAHQRLLAESDTVAVCLPLTSLFLREDYAPMRQLIDLGGLVAIATDCNPGSAMSTNLHLAMQLAVLRGGLTPQEAIRAVTNAGAMALGGQGGPLQWDGSLSLGERFVATTLDVPHPDVLFYQLGSPPRAVQ